MKANFGTKQLDLKALLHHVKRGFQKSRYFNLRKVKISVSIFELAKKYELCILKLLKSIEAELSHPCVQDYIQRAGHTQKVFPDFIKVAANELNMPPPLLLCAIESAQD